MSGDSMNWFQLQATRKPDGQPVAQQAEANHGFGVLSSWMSSPLINPMDRDTDGQDAMTLQRPMFTLGNSASSSNGMPSNWATLANSANVPGSDSNPWATVANSSNYPG